MAKLLNNACLWWKKNEFHFFISLFSGIALGTGKCPCSGHCENPGPETQSFVAEKLHHLKTGLSTDVWGLQETPTPHTILQLTETPPPRIIQNVFFHDQSNLFMKKVTESSWKSPWISEGLKYRQLKNVGTPKQTKKKTRYLATKANVLCCHSCHVLQDWGCVYI